MISLNNTIIGYNYFVDYTVYFGINLISRTLGQPNNSASKLYRFLIVTIMHTM